MAHTGWGIDQVDILGPGSIDDFGTSVALSSDGTKLIIGASQHVDGTEKGYARIYEREVQQFGHKLVLTSWV